MKKLLWIDEDVEFSETMQPVLGELFSFFRMGRVNEVSALTEYDAVIWDLTFAGHEQWRLIRDLRDHPRGRNLPILALFSRPMDLNERLHLNALRMAHADKWNSSWVLQQKIGALFT